MWTHSMILAVQQPECMHPTHTPIIHIWSMLPSHRTYKEMFWLSGNPLCFNMGPQ